jgi:predicted enzyme related to lactoylglutathione lyase
MKKKKMSPVIHFEMPYDNRERMARFYQAAFGWETLMLGADMENYVVAMTGESDDTGPTEKGRINGGFYARSAGIATRQTDVVMAVDDVRQSMKDVTAAGGKVHGEPVSIPGIGMFVYFSDTEGNVEGMLQPVPPSPQVAPAAKK